jgi:RNA recognition motif-containing protein
MMNIYVSNLSFNFDEGSLKDIFQNYGEVSSCSVIKDKLTGKSKGFGFVEMTNIAEGQKAIEGLNGTEHDGRKIIVNVARERTENRDRNSRGGDRRNHGKSW